MPTAIFVPDIPVKTEADDDQNQYSHEDLHNEQHVRTRLNLKVEISDDQDQHSSNDDLCNNGHQISRTEESVHPTTIITGNKTLTLRTTTSSERKKWLV